jgi:hypothetical protein
MIFIYSVFSTTKIQSRLEEKSWIEFVGFKTNIDSSESKTKFQGRFSNIPLWCWKNTFKLSKRLMLIYILQQEKTNRIWKRWAKRRKFVRITLIFYKKFDKTKIVENLFWLEWVVLQNLKRNHVDAKTNNGETLEKLTWKIK